MAHMGKEELLSTNACGYENTPLNLHEQGLRAEKQAKA
jgi:hypothetical protein